MSKRIVFCSDGTWDSPASQTNVYKLFKLLTVSADQMPFYDDGVGANLDPLQKFLGGAFGEGLFQKIKDAYTKISQVYEAGDQLYLFGFSRGAYTARSLAGMISACGLPTKNFNDAVVDTVFQAYRDKDDRARLLATLGAFEIGAAKITMVGVWETVGALGIPSVLGLVDPLKYGFLDTGLHPNVLNAYHAVSIDEKRSEFPPTLWTSEPAPGQTIEQAWFSGVHSDVGGGEPSDGSGTTSLSDIPLAWMIDRAQRLGLQFAPEAAANYPFPLDPKYALDKIHTSWTPLWGFPKHRSINKDALLANSVVILAQEESSWRPPNLVFENNVLASTYGIVEIMSQPQAAAVARASGAGSS
ncbi:MAG: DUF2235 domain-containing protein [Bryobacteraceae bacterium]